MNKTIKKTLKWAGIVIGVTGVGVTTWVLIKHPEVGNEIISKLKNGCKKATDSVSSDSTEPRSQIQEPKREGRNSDGYYKPRYYNNKKN